MNVRMNFRNPTQQDLNERMSWTEKKKVNERDDDDDAMTTLVERETCKSKVKNVSSLLVSNASLPQSFHSSFCRQRMRLATFTIELFMLLFVIYHIVHQF